MKKRLTAICVVLGLAAIVWLISISVSSMKIDSATGATRYSNRDGFYYIEVYHSRPFNLIVRNRHKEHAIPSHLNLFTLKHVVAIPTNSNYRTGEAKNWREQILGVEYQVGSPEDGTVIRVDATNT